MLLQWTLLQLASLGVDNGASPKNSTVPGINLAPLLDASHIRPPDPTQLLRPLCGLGCPPAGPPPPALPPAIATALEPPTPTQPLPTTATPTNAPDLEHYTDVSESEGGPHAPTQPLPPTATPTNAPDLDYATETYVSQDGKVHHYYVRRTSPAPAAVTKPPAVVPEHTIGDFSTPSGLAGTNITPVKQEGGTLEQIPGSGTLLPGSPYPPGVSPVIRPPPSQAAAGGLPAQEQGIPAVSPAPGITSNPAVPQLPANFPLDQYLVPIIRGILMNNMLKKEQQLAGRSADFLQTLDGIGGVTEEMNPTFPDTVAPRSDTVPGPASAFVATSSDVPTGDTTTQLTQQGNLTSQPGEGTVVSRSDTVPGPASAFVTTSSDVPTGDTTTQITQLGNLTSQPVPGTVVSRTDTVLGPASAFVATSSDVPTGDTTIQLTQQGNLTSQPGADTVVSGSDTVPGPASAFVASSSDVQTEDTTTQLTQQGYLTSQPAPDTVAPRSDTVPGPASAFVATSSDVPTGDTTTQLTQQGNLTSQPGPGTVVSGSDTVPGPASSFVATSSDVPTGDTTTQLTQQGNLTSQPAPGTVVSGSDTVPGPASAFVATSSDVPTGDTTTQLTQQGNLTSQPGPDSQEHQLKFFNGTVVSRSDTVPGPASVFVATSSDVPTGDTTAQLTQEGNLTSLPGADSQEHQLNFFNDTSANISGTPTGVVATPSFEQSAGVTAGITAPGSGTTYANVPGITSGHVATPSQVLTGDSAPRHTLQKSRGLHLGSGPTDGSILSHIPTDRTLEEYLAPVISEILLNTLRSNPQQLPRRSADFFQTKDGTRGVTEEMSSTSPEGLPHPVLRTRRSLEDLSQKYQSMLFAVNKFLDMRPGTQDFLVSLGIKMAAKQASAMVTDFGSYLKDWISDTASRLGLGEVGSMAGEMAETFLEVLAASLSNYIATLPHEAA